MPKYQNNTKRDISWEEYNIPAGTELEINVYLPYKQLGLKKVSDEPKVVTPILFSGVVTDEVIDVPYSSSYVLSVLHEDGDVKVYLGEDTEYPIILKSGMKYNSHLNWVYASTIKVEGSANILIERG